MIVLLDRTKAPKTRALVRRAVLTLAAGLVALVAMAAPAHADTPASWAEAAEVSGLQFLIVLVLIPAGLFLVIALFAALPSMMSDKGYEPGQTWGAEAEWFGGPRQGVEAADDLTAAQIEAAEADRGGASGTW